MREPGQPRTATLPRRRAPPHEPPPARAHDDTNALPHTLDFLLPAPSALLDHPIHRSHCPPHLETSKDHLLHLNSANRRNKKQETKSKS